MARSRTLDAAAIEQVRAHLGAFVNTHPNAQGHPTSGAGGSMYHFEDAISSMTGQYAATCVAN